MSVDNVFPEHLEKKFEFSEDPEKEVFLVGFSEIL